MTLVLFPVLFLQHPFIVLLQLLVNFSTARWTVAMIPCRLSGVAVVWVASLWRNLIDRFSSPLLVKLHFGVHPVVQTALIPKTVYQRNAPASTGKYILWVVEVVYTLRLDIHLPLRGIIRLPDGKTCEQQPFPQDKTAYRWSPAS
jgi:hypothetical protein